MKNLLNVSICFVLFCLLSCESENSEASTDRESLFFLEHYKLNNDNIDISDCYTNFEVFSTGVASSDAIVDFVFTSESYVFQIAHVDENYFLSVFNSEMILIKRVTFDYLEEGLLSFSEDVKTGAIYVFAPNLKKVRKYSNAFDLIQEETVPFYFYKGSYSKERNGYLFYHLAKSDVSTYPTIEALVTSADFEVKDRFVLEENVTTLNFKNYSFTKDGFRYVNVSESTIFDLNSKQAEISVDLKEFNIAGAHVMNFDVYDSRYYISYINTGRVYTAIVDLIANTSHSIWHNSPLSISNGEFKHVAMQHQGFVDGKFFTYFPAEHLEVLLSEATNEGSVLHPEFSNFRSNIDAVILFDYNIEFIKKYSRVIPF